MSFNPKEHNNRLLCIPLGGTNEIGINVTLYHFNGKYIMVDCGSGFPDENLPGVDMVVADLSFIEKHKEDLLAIVLTHAHEDHLGGIQYLWSSLECPIYATKFTKNFLLAKLTDFDLNDKVKIHEVATGSKLDLAPFNIEFIGLTHSAPEMQALMIRTEAGNILHTGDWKFDNDPVIGQAADENTLKEIGKEGVLALVCDSTNVFNAGESGSEGEVRKNIVKLVKEAKNMVVVTTFASNLARLDSILHAAAEAGRKVILSGKSLHRVIGAARDSGYFKDTNHIIDEREIATHKRNEILVIATGCQGEQFAATSKMANNNHQFVSLMPHDTVIFSSKIIPGNDKKIFRLFNIFVKQQIEVITEKDHFVHVSGHPAIDELKKMYQLVKPTICIPVHGEAMHIHEQARLARDCGIKHAVEVENGKVVDINEKLPALIGEVENGYLAVDGNYLIPDNSSVIKVRRRMRDSGAVFASLVLNGKGKMITEPSLYLPGLLDPRDDFELISSIKDDIADIVTRIAAKRYKGELFDKIDSAVKSCISKAIRSEMNKSPLIIVNIEVLRR